MIDFISTYTPAIADLTAETVSDTRERLATYIQTADDTVTTVPGSAVGDLVVTPQAFVLAGLETGLERVLSDMSLQNVADGTYYNCDFITSFLGNLGVYQYSTIATSGVIRIVFEYNLDYTLPRSTQYVCGDEYFVGYTPHEGDFLVYKVGTVIPSGVNGCVLIDSGEGTYYTDIPVVGTQDSEETGVTAGTTFSTQETIEGVASITALIDFIAGSKEYTITELAAMTQETVYSATPTTRGGVARLANNVCPFIDSIYALKSGDAEVLRDSISTVGGVRGNTLEVYARSSAYAFLETTNVLMTRVQEGDTYYYEGDFNYTGQPYFIESVTHTSLPDIENIEHTITATSDTNLGVLAAYTPDEKLTLRIDDSLDTNGETLYSTYVDEATGDRYTYFKVTYWTDPMLAGISDALTCDDNSPVNTSVVVRGFIPIIIEKFNVCFEHNSGVLPDLETAYTSISEYLSSLSSPEVYSEGFIAKIMQDAGARYVSDIRTQGYVQFSVGDNVQDLDGNIVPVKQVRLDGSSSVLRVKYSPSNNTTVSERMYACSPRNVRYFLKENAITFTETKEL